MSNKYQQKNGHPVIKKKTSQNQTAWKVSVFGIILVRIIPHSDWIEVSHRIQPECRKMRTRIAPNTDTFYAVLVLLRPERKIKQSSNNVLLRQQGFFSVWIADSTYVFP